MSEFKITPAQSECIYTLEQSHGHSPYSCSLEWETMPHGSVTVVFGPMEVYTINEAGECRKLTPLND